MLLYLDSCCFNRPFDALHTAAAESAGCDYLVTTDDDLIKAIEVIKNDAMFRNLTQQK